MASTAPLRIECRPSRVGRRWCGSRRVNGMLLGDGRVELREPGVVAGAARPAERREPLAGELDDRAALGGLVADRRHERRRRATSASVTPGAGVIDAARRLP